MPSSHSRNAHRHWLVIGNPESKRVSGFREAVERSDGASVSLLPWLDWLDSENIAPPSAGTIVRIESPGENVAVAKRLLRAGISPMEMAGCRPIEAAEIDRLDCSRGEILHPRQWFLGFASSLRKLGQAWSGSNVQWMSSPDSIVTAFDKVECLKRWTVAGLPTPTRWEDITSYHQLRESIPHRHARIFVKLRYGYSAMGSVALEWRDDKVRAITTVESVWSAGRPRLFVSKRPRFLGREFEIAWLIDTLGMEEIVVEKWLPKARWRGRSFDLRIVTIGGKPAHIVGRASSSPFTNLNLDSTRLSREEVVEVLGDRLQDVERLATTAAAALPDAFTLGIDILPRASSPRCDLLEANAFGDYLPGLLHEGRTTYDAEVAGFPRMPGFDGEQF